MALKTKPRKAKNAAQLQAAANASQKYEDARHKLGWVRRWVWMHPEDATVIRKYALGKAKVRAVR